MHRRNDSYTRNNVERHVKKGSNVDAIWWLKGFYVIRVINNKNMNVEFVLIIIINEIAKYHNNCLLQLDKVHFKSNFKSNKKKCKTGLLLKYEVYSSFSYFNCTVTL